MDENPVSSVILYKFEDKPGMKVERKIYNHSLEQFLMGTPAEDLEIIQESIKKGIPQNYMSRRSRKLRYDFLERDHLTQ